ncbi:TVP38/TMEM64 family inner membrane protein YdjZ [Rhodoplanes serenus]|uniref:Phospholipase D n=1 Tax=Rhodoplanes serenus TaxID=200615 RepID=A0A447CYN4_9BRAD|nr:VTT domain-containing protein [Rhodoplanes serenus]VCU10411.1 TVP38/TMEM64 family inner membrane protein YdjZ [Rhodoplanes serenus]
MTSPSVDDDLAVVADRILRPGHNVWRVEPTQRAAVLIDGEQYFSALRRSLLRARHAVLVVGWDIHSQTRLPRTGPDDDLPETLVDLLAALVERRPALTIRLLLWNYSVLFAGEREWFPSLAIDDRTPPQVILRLDDRLPFGSSQHQKIVLVDDTVAFAGGLDLTIRRWDRCAHRAADPDRVDPDGVPYAPFHDVQLVCDGAAAAALGDLAKNRWRRATGETLPSHPGDHDVWPDGVVPDIRDTRLAIARTVPCCDDGEPEAREIEALFLDSIDAARRSIYIENQFVTAAAMAERLAARMQRMPELELVVVTPRQYHSWIEANTMHAGRARFRRILEEAGVAARARFLFPQVCDGDSTADTMVHSKVMVVDDRLLRVGSANLNNRSMGADAECDVVLEAETEAERRAVARVRNRLIADHCGVGEQAVADQLARTGSLLRTVETLSGGGHRLCPVSDPESPPSVLPLAIEPIADPAAPISVEAVTRQVIGPAQARRLPVFAKIGAVALVLIGLVLAWRTTPLAQFTDIERVRALLEGLGTVWAPVAVAGVYVVAGLLGFPVTVLIAATAMVYGAWLGLLYATLGALVSAAVGFAIGAKLGQEPFIRLLGPRLNKIRRKITRRGVLAVAAIRVLPIAPFTVINLLSGAGGVRFADFMGGTLLGLTPGLVAMSVFGDRLLAVIRDPTPGRIAVAVGLLAGWIALAFGIQAVVSRRGGRDEERGRGRDGSRDP